MAGRDGGIGATSRRGSPTASVVALIAVTAAAAALRFPTLDVQSFWSDEAVTALLMRLSFADLLSGVVETESTPPLYYALAWLWTHAFGAGEVGLRSLSALAGTLAVPAVFAAGRELASARVGLAAAAIVATHPLLVWYSQEARAYALVVLAIAVALYVFLRVLRSGGARGAALWAAAVLLAMATHYFALFVVLPMAVALLLARRETAVRVAVAGAAVGGMTLLPLLVAQRTNAAAAWIDEVALWRRLPDVAKDLLVGPNAPYDRVGAAVVAVSSVVGAALALQVLRGHRAAFVGVAGAGLGLPVALALGGADYVTTRNMVVTVVPTVLLVCAGLSAPARLLAPAVAAACLVNVALVTAVARDARYHRADWRGAAATAADGIGPKLVVVGPDWDGWFARAPLRVYLPDARRVDRGRNDPPRRFQRVVGWDDATAASTVRVRELVLVTVGGSTPQQLIAGLPDGEFRLVGRASSGRFALLRYRSGRLIRVPLDTLALDGPVYGRDVGLFLLGGPGYRSSTR